MGVPEKSFKFDEGDRNTIHTYVYQALGAAAMGWGEIPKGPLDYDWIKHVGEKLIEKIQEWDIDANQPVVSRFEDYRPTGWWRAIDSEGKLWCESSDKAEVLARARPTDIVQYQVRAVSEKWVVF